MITNFLSRFVGLLGSIAYLFFSFFYYIGKGLKEWLSNSWLIFYDLVIEDMPVNTDIDYSRKR